MTTRARAVWSGARPARAATLLVLLLLAGTLGGCGGDGGARGAAAGSPSGSVPRPAPSSPARPPVSTPQVAPLTGRVGAGGRVLAVKIDNTRPSHPQIGLTSADVIYVEEVEGGLSRIMAIFASRLPPRVGPVRSARISDIEILQQYGPVAFAYSGANSGMVRLLRQTDLRNVSFDDARQGYVRVRGRRSPYNVVGDPQVLLARGGGSVPAKNIGFRFGTAPAGGRAARRAQVRYPAATIAFDWVGGHWAVTMDGRADTDVSGARLAADTVVLQHVQVEPSSFRDVRGNPTPYVRTIGQGTVQVLRDGKVYDGTWRRPDPRGPTTFLTPSGPLTFAAGQTWVILVPAGSNPTIT